MSIEMSVEEHGSRKAALDLHRLGERAADVTPMWARLNELFHQDEQQRFSSEGPGWQELADKTLENKLREGQPPNILEATGRLRRSLTSGAPVRRSNRTGGLVFGTDVPYARFHQYGTAWMPKRKVVGLSARTYKEMVKLIGRYVVEGKT